MAVYRFFTGSVNSLLSRNLKIVNHEQSAALSGRVLEKLGLPVKPKKPLTPYIKFCNSRRQKLMSDQPSLNPRDVLKTLAQQWLDYDEDGKSILKQEYESEKEHYDKLVLEYKCSLTPDHLELIEHAKQREKNLKILSKEHKRSRSLGKPKKPMTAFFQFLNEHKHEKDENMKYTEFTKEMGISWKCLLSDEKEKYFMMWKKAMEHYQTDLEAWEKKMIDDGHLDVIRKTSIPSKEAAK